MPRLVGPRPAPPDRFDRRLLAPMMLGSILNPINSSITAVALVPIGAALGVPASQTAWLVSALYLATAVGQPLMGGLVDRYGARRMFLFGCTLTVVAGVVGSLAGSLWVLVVARVILGLGTCAGYPSAMSLIRGEADRTAMASPAGVLATLSVTTQTIAVVGPTLGGVLIGMGGWRATLAVNIVLGAAGLVLGLRYLPRQEVDGTQTPPVDVAGIASFVVAAVAGLLLVMEPSLQRLWLLPVSVVAAVAFVGLERRRTSPFIDVRLVARNRPLLATYVRAMLASTVSYSFLYGFTQWLQDGRRLSPSAAGLVLLPTFALGIVVVTLTGRRAGLRAKLLVGGLAQVLASVLILTVDDTSGWWLLLLIATVLGLPQGLVSLANQNAVFHQSPHDGVATAAGISRTFMYLGAIASSAVAGLLFGPRADTAAVHTLGWCMVAASTLMVLLTVVDRSLPAIDARLARQDAG